MTSLGGDEIIAPLVVAAAAREGELVVTRIVGFHTDTKRYLRNVVASYSMLDLTRRHTPFKGERAGIGAGIYRRELSVPRQTRLRRLLRKWDQDRDHPHGANGRCTAFFASLQVTMTP